jgi:hypothetical protein
MTASAMALRAGLALAGATVGGLWTAQLSLGGTLTEAEVEAALKGTRALTPHEHDVLAQALNDMFVDAGQDHPVAYWDDLDSTATPRPDSTRAD